MKIVVGSMSTKLQEFLRKYQFNSRVTVIHKMCNVKLIKEPSDVIIPFGVINEYGLVSNTQVHLEELLMSVDVKKIIYGNIRAKNKIEEIANRHQVETVYMDFRTLDRTVKL